MKTAVEYAGVNATQMANMTAFAAQAEKSIKALAVGVLGPARLRTD